MKRISLTRLVLSTTVLVLALVGGLLTARFYSAQQAALANPATDIPDAINGMMVMGTPIRRKRGLRTTTGLQ